MMAPRRGVGPLSQAALVPVAVWGLLVIGLASEVGAADETILQLEKTEDKHEKAPQEGVRQYHVGTINFAGNSF